jgi:chromosome segregation ATPase
VPEWAVSITVALIPGLAAVLASVATLRKVRSENETNLAQAASAAREAATKEWAALTESQREAMAEYRARLVEVTNRLREVEAQLLCAQREIAVLGEKVRELEDERLRLSAERDALRQKIAEVEAGK